MFANLVDFLYVLKGSGLLRKVRENVRIEFNQLSSESTHRTLKKHGNDQIRSWFQE